MSETITLILPAYNEALRIEHTVNEAVAYFEKKAIGYEIIVSADGNDGTRDAVAWLRSLPSMESTKALKSQASSSPLRLRRYQDLS